MAGPANGCGFPAGLCRHWDASCSLFSHCGPRGQTPAVQQYFAVTTRFVSIEFVQSWLFFRHIFFSVMCNG